MLAGVVSPTVAKMLAEREDEDQALRDRVSGRVQAVPTILPHPALKARFEARVRDLRASLSNPENRSEVGKVLAELVEEVVVYPPSAETPVEIEVVAHAGQLIEWAQNDERPARAGLSRSAIKVVAGTRFDLDRDLSATKVVAGARFDLCRVRKPMTSASAQRGWA